MLAHITLSSLSSVSPCSSLFITVHHCSSLFICPYRPFSETIRDNDSVQNVYFQTSFRPSLAPQLDLGNLVGCSWGAQLPKPCITGITELKELQRIEESKNFDGILRCLFWLMNLENKRNICRSEMWTLWPRDLCSARDTELCPESLDRVPQMVRILNESYLNRTWNTMCGTLCVHSIHCA